MTMTYYNMSDIITAVFFFAAVAFAINCWAMYRIIETVADQVRWAAGVTEPEEDENAS